MSRTFFFEVLIGLMQARRMGFKELAAELKLPESELQSMFHNQDCSLSCMENTCNALGLEFEELISAVPKSELMIQQLSHQMVTKSSMQFTTQEPVLLGIKINDFPWLGYEFYKAVDSF